MNEKYNPININPEQLSPERPLFSEAVEKIKINERAVKLLNLMENGFLLSQEEMDAINMNNLVGGLRIKYPTIDDIQIELLQTIEDYIGADRSEVWTNEQYEQACKEKQSQYEIAAKEIIDTLNPIYEKYGAVSSEDVKNRIWENINDIIDFVDPNNISDHEKSYLIKNISAAARQELNADEARLIMQIKEYFLKNISVESRTRPQAEKIERPISKKELDISDFKKYIEKNYQKIEGELHQGRDLDDIFYRDFYMQGFDNSEYKESDLQVQELKKKYNVSIAKVWEEFGYGRVPNISVTTFPDKPNFTYCIINEGYNEKKDTGRFYLNLKPEYVGYILTKAMKLFYINGLHVDMKVLTEGNVDTFNRCDKMLIAFNAEEEKKAVQVLEILYKDNKETFNETGVPCFATEMKDSSNEKMAGIGFGEEPDSVYGGLSFGQIRVEILSMVYQDAKYCGLSASDSRFDFNSSFETHCRKFNVNPKNPAFNASNDQEKFSTIKRMIV